jgi:hypothetical protein
MPTPSLNATTNTLRAIRNAIRNGRIPDADDQVEAMDRAIGLLDAQATAQPIGYQRKHPTEGWLTVRDEDRDYYRNQGQEIRAVYAIGKPAPDAPANEPSEKPAPAVIDSVISLLGELHTALAYNNVGNGRAKLREAIKILRDGFISVSRVSNDPVKRFSTSAIMWALDGCGLKPTPDGEWVRYSDHVAALAAQRATPPAERVVEADAEPANCISFDTKDRLVGALRTAIDHIEHMSAFLSKLQAGYSFEGIGEDMPNLRDALASATSSDVTKYPAGVSSRDHIAHDMKIGRFPRQSSIDTFLRERALATKPAVKDDETVVEALPNWNGWRSIDTAPEDCRVILATAGGWVCEAIMLRDEDTGEQVWTWVDTGKPSLHSCYGWMPLPAPLVAPVLSDLRPDGFDGPTGAE